jgi:hypothetical protein
MNRGGMVGAFQDAGNKAKNKNNKKEAIFVKTNIFYYIKSICFTT